MSSCLRPEASASCSTIGAPSVSVVSVSHDNCIVPAMPVISVIQSLTLREHGEKVLDAPMSAFALVARPVGIEQLLGLPVKKNGWAFAARENGVAGMNPK